MYTLATHFVNTSHFLVFWQYGTISWSTFLTFLQILIYTTETWAIFAYDDNIPNRHGAQQSASDEIVSSGAYILLRQGKRSSITAISLSQKD
jgi:hypothetical protein